MLAIVLAATRSASVVPLKLRKLQLQKELDESEKKFRTVIDISPVIIWGIDKNGIISTYINNLGNPTAICIDKNQNLYVVDYLKHKII